MKDSSCALLEGRCNIRELSCLEVVQSDEPQIPDRQQTLRVVLRLFTAAHLKAVQQRDILFRLNLLYMLWSRRILARCSESLGLAVCDLRPGGAPIDSDLSEDG